MILSDVSKEGLPGAIELIRNLAVNVDVAQSTLPVTLDGKSYLFSTKPTPYGHEVGSMLMAPMPEVLKVSTLTGFRDAFDLFADRPGLIVHVVDHLTIELKTASGDAWDRRHLLLHAVYPQHNTFPFDNYLSPAKFITLMQSCFLQTEKSLNLIKLVSNLKAGDTVHSEDDGFNQKVTIKTGEVSSADVRVKPRIKLIPRRTFDEAAPVETEFLVRMQAAQNALPTIALFAVDGNAWIGESMRAIKNWLEKNLPSTSGIPIIA